MAPRKKREELSMKPRVVAGVATLQSSTMWGSAPELAKRREEAMSKAALEGMSKGETDDAIRKRIREAAASVTED